MIRIHAALTQLAQQEPTTRALLIPMLRQADKWKTLPNGWDASSREKFWESLTGDNKHKVTKCIKEMDGKFDDPGAFCASLADRVMGPEWRSKKAGPSSVPVPTASLPPSIKRVLAEVRFNKRQIYVRVATNFSMYSAGDDGAKGFTALVDIDTNQSNITWGAFGGGALGQKPSPVDDVNTPQKPLPDHLVVVQGQVGGRDPYASLICTAKALPRLTGKNRLANGDMLEYLRDHPGEKPEKRANTGSSFITPKTTALAKAIYNDIKKIPGFGGDPDIPSNVGGVIKWMFYAQGNHDAFQKVHLLLGNMPGVGSGSVQGDDLRSIARRFSRDVNEGEVVAIGILLLRAARRPRAAAAFEKWAEANLNLDRLVPADSAVMTPSEAFEATITPEIQGLAGWAWGQVSRNPDAAEALCFDLAQDANWHSVKSVGEQPGVVLPEELAVEVAKPLHWSLEDIAAFNVALLRLAGRGSQAEAMKKEALRTFPRAYQAVVRVATRYLAKQAAAQRD